MSNKEYRPVSLAFEYDHLLGNHSLSWETLERPPSPTRPPWFGGVKEGITLWPRQHFASNLLTAYEILKEPPSAQELVSSTLSTLQRDELDKLLKNNPGYQNERLLSDKIWRASKANVGDMILHYLSKENRMYFDPDKSVDPELLEFVNDSLVLPVFEDERNVMTSTLQIVKDTILQPENLALAEYYRMRFNFTIPLPDRRRNQERFAYENGINFSHPVYKEEPAEEMMRRLRNTVIQSFPNRDISWLAL